MEPFIRSYQYNFIKTQTKILVSGHSMANDADVLQALKSLSIEKVLNLFSDINEEQKQLLNPIVEIKDKEDAQEFLLQLKPYVIPFKEVSEKTIMKLFPKVKKLKVPSLEEIDRKETSYLGWKDKGSDKKYIVAEYEKKLIGLQGTVKSSNKKGICTLCNRHENVEMFVTETKGTTKGTFTKRGNYICQDSQSCNQNITSLDKLNEFITLLKK